MYTSILPPAEVHGLRIRKVDVAATQRAMTHAVRVRHNTPLDGLECGVGHLARIWMTGGGNGGTACACERDACVVATEAVEKAYKHHDTADDNGRDDGDGRVASLGYVHISPLYNFV